MFSKTFKLKKCNMKKNSFMNDSLIEDLGRFRISPRNGFDKCFLKDHHGHADQIKCKSSKQTRYGTLQSVCTLKASIYNNLIVP